MRLCGSKTIRALLATGSIVGGLSLAYAQQEKRGATSYMPADIKESFGKNKTCCNSLARFSEFPPREPRTFSRG